MEHTTAGVLHGVDTEHGGGRIISLVHRVKATTRGESRPTMMGVLDPLSGGSKVYELSKEEDEVALAYGHLVVTWRAAADDEDLDSYPGYAKRAWGRKMRVAAEYDGVRRGDTLIMTLGGSGLYLNYGLAFLCERVGARAVAISTNHLAEMRNGAPKADDVLTMARLYQEAPEAFYPMRSGNRVYMEVTHFQRLFDRAQQARIAEQQRLEQEVIGQVFMSDYSVFPYDSLREAKERAAEESPTLAVLMAEEERAKKQLERALDRHPGAMHLLTVGGIGPSIAGRILGPIGDPIRFIVFPDMDAVLSLRCRAKELEERGGFESEAALIAPVVQVMDEGGGCLVEKKLSHTEMLVAAAIRLRGRGEPERAQCLSDAVRVFQDISALYKRAAEKSARKMVAYCGAHVLPDGTFPRRRRTRTLASAGVVDGSGEFADSADDDMEDESASDGRGDERDDTPVFRAKANNWSTRARQAIWNWGDQLIKRPGSAWGKRFRNFKERFTLRHAGDDDWSPGRIHRKALWRSRTRMLHGVFAKWCREVIKSEVREKIDEAERADSRSVV